MARRAARGTSTSRPNTWCILYAYSMITRDPWRTTRAKTIRDRRRLESRKVNVTLLLFLLSHHPADQRSRSRLSARVIIYENSVSVSDRHRLSPSTPLSLSLSPRDPPAAIKSSFSWRTHEGGCPLIKETLFDRNFLGREQFNSNAI